MHKQTNLPRLNHGKRKKLAKQGVTCIVIHSTRSQNPPTGDAPFHYVLDKEGCLTNRKPVGKTDTGVDVALVGGIDERGFHVDDRTAAQNEALFETLIRLSERFPNARIMGADQYYQSPDFGPGFDVAGWLSLYIPQVLAA